MWVLQEECSVQDRVQTCSSINMYTEPSGTIYSLKTHTSNFVFNTFRNGKPVQFFSSEKFEEKNQSTVKSCMCSAMLSHLNLAKTVKQKQGLV